MPGGKVPKWAERKLLDGEKVIARFEFFYATDRRLLSFQGLLDLASLEYNKISSITIEKFGLFSSIIRFTLVVIGLLLIAIGIISFLGIEFRYDNTSLYTGLPLYAVLVSLVGGVACIIMAFFVRKYYYQIRNPTFNKFEFSKWRIPKSRKGDQFIEIIKKQSGISIEE